MNLKQLDSLTTEKKIEVKKNKEKIPEVKSKNPTVIDSYYENKQKIKNLQTQLSLQEEEIIKEGEAEILQNELKENYTPSVYLTGEKHKVRVTKSSVYRVIKPIDEIKKEIKNGLFNELFDVNVEISLKSDVFKNERLLQQLISKFSEEEFKMFFDTKKVIKPKSNFKEKFYKLTPNVREKVAKVVKRNKSGVYIK